MPRTKEQNKEIREKTKKLILDSAFKLFAEKGFQSTSMNDIAMFAGVSKGLAYNYFESKQKIVEEIMNNVIGMFAEVYKPIQLEKDPYIKLEKFTDLTFNWIQESFDFWKMLITIWLQPGVMENSMDFMHNLFQELFSEMEDIFKEIGVADYVAEARIFGAIMDGVSIDYMIDKYNYPLDLVVQQIKRRYSKDSLKFLIK